MGTFQEAITFGVLTVSDRCFRNEAVDESGPNLEKILKESYILPNCRIEARSCVPDEKDIIEKILREWADEKDIHVILTTGGTGFAPRDVTPEATRNVIEKEASGVALAMAKASLDITPMAMLSRAVCGIRKHTLIVNLPGSKKAASECLGFIIQCLPHAVSVIRNLLNQVQQFHNTFQYGENSTLVSNEKKVNQSETNHVCGHHKQRSKVDTSLVARRLRKSPYPMVSYADSVVLVDEVVSRVNRSSQEVNVRDALGCVLFQSVVAKENLPPFPASVKDGYAVKASDGSGVRKVVANSIAGSQPTRWRLSDGECIRINTGAPVPEGADAVVQVEDTVLVTEGGDGRQEVEIEISVAPKVGQDIRAVGYDISKGQVIAAVSGNPLTSQDLALFAAAGVHTVKIYKRPVIAIFSTGNELQEPGKELIPGQVWDSNRLMLSSLFKEAGLSIVDLGIARDEPNEMFERMRAALQCSDVVITTGSVSMGDKDMLKEVLKSDFHAEILFGRVNLKPGKPTTFATCTVFDLVPTPKLIFCLPGNPVSAYVTSHLYVLRAVRALSGYNQINLTSIFARIQTGQKVDEREEFKRGIVTCKGNEDATVEVIGGCMLSSNILSCQSSNCLVRIPPKTELGKNFVEPNTFVECLLTGKL